MRIDPAIVLLHHVVQDHGDGATHLGRSNTTDPFEFFQRKLGWSWPPDYRELLRRHDGFRVADFELYSFLQSFEAFLLLRDSLERQQLWPVSSDGCGNYFATQLRDQPSSIYFLEGSREYEPDADLAPEPLPEWLSRNLRRVCTANGCSGHGA